MQLFYPRRSLVHSPIYRGSGSKGTPYHSANTSQETCERFCTFFPVDDFHRRYVVAEKDAWNTAPNKTLAKML